MADNLYTDPKTQELINSRIKNQISLESDPDKAIAAGQLKTIEPYSFDYGKDPMNQAVLNRAKAKLYGSPGEFQDLQKLQYVKNRSESLQNAAVPLKGLEQVNRQMEALRRQRNAAEEAQRAQVLSSVLGLGGAVAGAAIAGPGGAAAGAQVGSAMGNSAGQSYNSGGNYA